jgi:hypothetical protein
MPIGFLLALLSVAHSYLECFAPAKAASPAAP